LLSDTIAVMNTLSEIDLKPFRDKVGIEVGGPSGLFESFLPLYQVVKRVDGVNYSEHTLWDNPHQGVSQYIYGEGKLGDQYIVEATDLLGIADNTYDFLLSSHSLEHIANPMKAVKEWLRVLKSGSQILIIVPNKEYCFDHRRQNTTFEHVLDDYYKNIGEDDLTHLEEILQYHDLEMDKAAGTFEQFKKRSEDNLRHRALHHHVFSLQLVSEIFTFFNIKIESAYVDGLHIVCMGKVPPKGPFGRLRQWFVRLLG